ncbi:hypothetical protein EMIHUDRAFT_451841 [Emiliania huxleyi CCMP1516]|uniref:Transketolase signature 1 domain-containing protein n=2 Tax=Emiliania huxleyi TaxID=2903 RepID=A0A0D3IS14_EMIH1|nr:hypothetical protein EMIHUDRAFT_451841 [Emiliania huxleyi CCMP1516]EOD14049.1 hypothetical protein EMIHUDRAFT_451841 [Emiliania huxleyi CCMP1516]|eukprot:XP_005766478.1 hypothetical protein EMIHUDRAFT_451841 [Emiliania huxleyi CCMP1516]
MSLLLGLYSAPSLGLGGARTACATSRAHACMQQQQQPGPPYAGPRSTPLLDTVSTPNDLKGFSLAELKQLSHELRWETINAVSKTGGHLGSSLGVVELTVALHYVFNTPADPVYPHKILTGRRERMPTLRQAGGLSGFAKRSESAERARQRAEQRAQQEQAQREEAERRARASQQGQHGLQQQLTAAQQTHARLRAENAQLSAASQSARTSAIDRLVDTVDSSSPGGTVLSVAAGPLAHFNSQYQSDDASRAVG